MSVVALTIFLMACVESVNPLTGAKWNKYSRTFEPIPGLMTYEQERQKIIGQSRLLETHNFNRASMNLTYYEDMGFYEFHDNNTRVSGIFGDMWTVMSEFLNFTLVLTKPSETSLGITNPNGTYTGILEYARLNQTDVIVKIIVYTTRLAAVEFSHVFWMSSLRIFASGQWKSDRTWMFKLLSMDVWILILVILILISGASLVTQKISIRYQKQEILTENFFSHFFYSFSMMCNQSGSFSNSTGSGSNTINLTVAVFAFLTLTAFNSRLIYNLARESFEAPFNDLEELYKTTEYHVVVLKGTPAHITFDTSFAMPIFHRIKKARRLTIVTEVDDLYRKVCNEPNKYVFVDSEDSVAARGIIQCPVFPVGIYYYLLPIAAGFSRRLIHRKAIDIGILKLRQFGLFDAIKKRYMHNSGRERASRQPDSFAIDLDRVSLIFGVLAFGIILSIIICIIENIVFVLKKRKTEARLANRIMNVRQPIQNNRILIHRGRLPVK